MINVPGRFSQLYCVAGLPSDDSMRMRRRISRVFLGEKLYEVVDRADIERVTGCKIPRHAYGTDWDKFFELAELRDLLDSITVIATKLSQKGRNFKRWTTEIEQIFREENVSYTLNDTGEVHFAQDVEFQRNRMSTIAALGAPRYRAALDHFSAAQQALNFTPPRTREAIRQTYEAIETVFRLILPEVGLLGPSEVEKKLTPRVLGSLKLGTERDCLKANVSAFKHWVIGAQGYRHGQGTEEPDNPSQSTAVLCVSSGATYLRWLVEIDAGAQPIKQISTGV